MRRHALRHLTPAARGLLALAAALLSLPLLALLLTLARVGGGLGAPAAALGRGGAPGLLVARGAAPLSPTLRQALQPPARPRGPADAAAYLRRPSDADMAAQLERVGGHAGHDGGWGSEASGCWWARAAATCSAPHFPPAAQVREHLVSPAFAEAETARRSGPRRGIIINAGGPRLLANAAVTLQVRAHARAGVGRAALLPSIYA
jgi:hypothetical protein